MSVKALIGVIIHCLEPYKLTVLDKGFVIIDNGKIIAIGNSDNFETTKNRLGVTPDVTINLTNTQLLLPGFIDAHIHAPQYPNAGLGYDKPLLEWLDDYTYNLEKKYRDEDLSEKVFNAVVRKTLDYGTTTACYFGSLFNNSTKILANAVTKHGQRAFVGKLNMIKLAPDDYLETPEESINNTLQFIKDVKDMGNPLVQPIITPRFALSVDMDLMKKLGEIAKEQDLHIQTHISENKDEIKMVQKLYNDTYTNVYFRADLLGPKTVLAHGIYLSDTEMDVLSKTKTSIAHCPESNINIASGTCEIRRLQKHGVTIGLGTDVSGGASPSIMSAMRSAISASIHISFTTDYKPLNYEDVFYLATLGGAKALALDSEIGNFEVGKSFDAIIVDLNVQHSSVDYLLDCTPNELLQKLVFIGDDRNILQVYVNGKVVKG